MRWHLLPDASMKSVKKKMETRASVVILFCAEMQLIIITPANPGERTKIIFTVSTFKIMFR